MLILLPGWGADGRCFDSLRESLAEEDFSCRVLEYRDRDLRDPERLLDELAEELDAPCYLLGWSLGGMLALRLAEKCPQKVVAVATIASNLRFVADATWPDAMAPEHFANFLESYVGDPQKTAQRFLALQAQGDEQRRSVRDSLGCCSALNEDPRADLAGLQLLAQLSLKDSLTNIRVPLMMMFGDADALVPAAAARAIARQYHQVETVLISGAGHAPHLAQAARVARELKRVFSPHERDKQRVARSFDRAANSYDGCAHMQRSVAKKLGKWMTEVGPVLLDLGCGTGYCLDELRTRYKTGIGLDIAPAMLQRARTEKRGDTWLCADLENLPLADASVDTAVSNLALQWLNSLDTAFSELDRVLKSGACFAFTTLSGGTLAELRQAWTLADPMHVHVNRFDEPELVMAAADKVSWQLELYSFESLCIDYATVFDLMRDLKGIGAHNINAGGPRGMSGRKAFRDLEAAYEQFRRRGMLPASYELNYWIYRKTQK